MKEDFNHYLAMVRPIFSEIDQKSSSTDVWVACSQAARMFRHGGPGVMAMVYTACSVLLSNRKKAMPPEIEHTFFDKYREGWYGEDAEDEGTSVREGGRPLAFEDHRRILQAEPLRDAGGGFGRRDPGQLGSGGEERTFSIRGRGEEAGEDES